MRLLERSLQVAAADLVAKAGGSGAASSAYWASGAILQMARQWHIDLGKPIPNDLETEVPAENTTTGPFSPLRTDSGAFAVSADGSNVSPGGSSATRSGETWSGSTTGLGARPHSVAMPSCGSTPPQEEKGLLSSNVRAAVEELQNELAAEQAEAWSPHRRLAIAQVAMNLWNAFSLPGQLDSLSERMLADLELCENMRKQTSSLLGPGENAWAHLRLRRLAVLFGRLGDPSSRAEIAATARAMKQLWEKVAGRSTLDPRTIFSWQKRAPN